MKNIDRFFGEYRFLSNFWPVVVMFEGTAYPSTEHAYQAAKTLDLDERERIRNATTPGIAKKLGKKVTIRADWEAVKVAVMRQLIQAKFNPMFHSDLCQQLLATGDAELIEGNTWGDKIWGVCKGEGQNLLGVLLMQQREMLRNNT